MANFDVWKTEMPSVFHISEMLYTSDSIPLILMIPINEKRRIFSECVKSREQKEFEHTFVTFDLQEAVGTISVKPHWCFKVVKVFLYLEDGLHAQIGEKTVGTD